MSPAAIGRGQSLPSPAERASPSSVLTFGELVLSAALAATIVMGGAFAHLKLGPLYVTDAALFSLLTLAVPFYPHRFFSWGKVEKLLVAYVALCALHVLAAYDHGMWTLKDATLGGYALFALLVPVFATSMDRLARLAAVAFTSVVALAAYVVFFPDIGGNTSFYLGAGAVGALAGLCWRTRWGGSVAFCVFVLQMVASGKRASALALLAAATTLFVALPSAGQRRLLRGFAIVLVCGAVLGGIAMSVPSLATRLRLGAQRYFSGTVGYRSDGTAQWRLGAWRNAVELIRAHPVGGVGFGTPVDVYPVDEPPQKIESPFNYGLPHNTYLTVALKTGIPGLTLLLTALAAWLRCMWRLRARSAWACGVVALGVYGCFYGYFALFFERPFMAFPFWVVIGIGLSLERLTARLPQKPQSA
jgi:O-antigen ligase